VWVRLMDERNAGGCCSGYAIAASRSVQGPYEYRCRDARPGAYRGHGTRRVAPTRTRRRDPAGLKVGLGGWAMATNAQQTGPTARDARVSPFELESWPDRDALRRALDSLSDRDLSGWIEVCQMKCDRDGVSNSALRGWKALRIDALAEQTRRDKPTL